VGGEKLTIDVAKAVGKTDLRVKQKAPKKHTPTRRDPKAFVYGTSGWVLLGRLTCPDFQGFPA
jgi:hypothetical protein